MSDRKRGKGQGYHQDFMLDYMKVMSELSLTSSTASFLIVRDTGGLIFVRTKTIKMETLRLNLLTESIYLTLKSRQPFQSDG